MGKLMKNGRPYGGHSTTAATVTYTDTHNVGATNTQDALDKVAQRVISQSAASGVSYTDTNNIGAANVQSALDTLGSYSSNAVTLNSNYVSSGWGLYTKVGKMCVVSLNNIVFSALPPRSGSGYSFATGLPKAKTMSANITFMLVPMNPAHPPIRLILVSQDAKLQFYWTESSVTAGAEYAGFVVYPCE